MFFSSVLDLLKCKSLPQHSRKAERDHVTSDARQITSAHPFLCLRFGGMVTKQLYDMETAQLEGCSHEFSHQVGRWKQHFPLTVSEEQHSRNFLLGSCINRWRASALQLLSSRAPETIGAPVLQSCTPQGLLSLEKKESSKGTLVQKISVLLKQKEKKVISLGGRYRHIYIYLAHI